MHEELMEGFSGWDHREDVFSLCDDSFHDDGTFVVFEEFFHFGSEVFLFCDSNSFDAHRFGELDEIGIHLFRMRISFFIENILPLLDHPVISIFCKGQVRNPWNSLLRMRNLALMLN